MFKLTALTLLLFLGQFGLAEEIPSDRSMFKLAFGDQLPTPSGPFRYFLDSERPDIQKMIEQALLNVVATPTGKTLCRLATQNGNPAMVAYYGTSKPTYDALISSCASAGLFSGLKGSASEEFYLGGHRFSFLITPVGVTPPPYTGWTNDVSTLLFFQEGKTSLLEITRTVAHEFVQIADYKRYFTQNKELKSLLSPESQNVFCEISHALSNPSIKLAFSALRAFDGENRIIEELNEKPVSLGEGVSCMERLEDMIPRVRFYGRAALIEQGQDLLRYPECQFPKALYSEDEALKILQKVVIEKEGRKKSLCEYLETLETEFPEVPRRWAVPNGPRPRIADGGGD